MSLNESVGVLRNIQRQHSNAINKVRTSHGMKDVDDSNIFVSVITEILKAPLVLNQWRFLHEVASSQISRFIRFGFLSSGCRDRKELGVG
jgi:hypothetical protein